MVDTAHFDVVFCGGGLASGLAAFRLAQKQPDTRIAIVERGPILGGNHTWSFHETDLTPAASRWIAPFVTAQWSSQTIRFPARTRTLSTGYRTITSERFDQTVRTVPNISVITGVSVTAVTATQVTLEDGRDLSCRAVLDGRGDAPSPALELGFQKFLGQEVTFAEPHGLDAPIIMDATIPQLDGYRFVYVLPFTENSALIEDTYYSDGNHLDPEGLRTNINAYAHAQGWSIKSLIREEQGVLPIILDGDITAYWAERQGGPVPIGLRAGLFNPVTGYSLPDAVRMADRIAVTPLRPEALFSMVQTYATAKWHADGFYRMLNRMLFRAAKPDQRWSILQRFYGLNEPLIERFYAGNSTLGDKVRILAGKPPVPIGDALGVIRSRFPRTMKNKGMIR
ncbi:MAG: lycopene beta-cyclase CrtY [Parvularcula sp.]